VQESHGIGAGTLESRGAVVKDMMSHKGYCGSVHFNDEDEFNPARSMVRTQNTTREDLPG
jgi:hypothetical protein